MAPKTPKPKAQKPWRPALACDVDLDKVDWAAGMLVQAKIDGCFSRDTLIWTTKGMIPIGKIVDQRLAVQVFSYNEVENCLEVKRVVSWFNNGTKTGYNFRGSKVTGNHRMFTKGGWIEGPNCEHNFSIDNKYLMSVVTGMLLGDASITIEKREGMGQGSQRIIFATSEADEGYGDAKAGILSELFKVSKSKYTSGYGHPCFRFNTSIAHIQPIEAWRFYDVDEESSDFGQRKSTVTAQDLKWFDDLSLALWYFDDGSFTYNNGNEATPRISFSVPRYSETTHEEFKKLFQVRYGFQPEITRYERDVRMTFTSAQSVYLLWRMARTASGMMPRKFPESLRLGVFPKPIKKCNLVETKPAVTTSAGSAAFVGYDIEVEDNHNYFANGVLVHNCRALNRTGRLVGRSLKEHANPHITNLFSDERYIGFDGELVTGSWTDSDLCRKTSGNCSRKSADSDYGVVWYVFDYIVDGMLDRPYIERLEAVAELVGEMNRNGNHRVATIPHFIVYSLEEFLDIGDGFIREGFEGAIIRDPRQPYKSGRATTTMNNYLRLKRFVDFEGEVVEIIEAMENTNVAKTNELGRSERSSHKENMLPKGMVGMLKVKALQDVILGDKVVVQAGTISDVGPGKMTHEDRVHYFNNQSEIVGKLAKVKFFGHGMKDSIRFPTFVCIRAEEDMSA